MHIVLLTTGLGDDLTAQHLRIGEPVVPTPFVDLLILDSRNLSEECLNKATNTIADIRARHGLRHGILFCSHPSLPLIVASIRCGLRDVITNHIDAFHLRLLLRSARPSLTRREYHDAVSLLRAFSSFGGGGGHSDGNSVSLARKTNELNRRAEALDEASKALALEKDRLVRAEQDIRERTRRLDRQIARLQNDTDVAASPYAASGVASAPPIPDYSAMAQRLEQRAAELNLREKLLDEMQSLLLSTPQASTMAKDLSLALPATKARDR